MKRTLLNVICYALIFLFLYASASKLLDYQRFIVQIGQSPLLADYAATLAWAVPLIEIVTAVLLFLPTSRLYGLYSSFGIMAMFTGYIYVIMNYAERVPCSCGGILNKMGWNEHLIFNICFTLLAVAGIIIHTVLLNDSQKNLAQDISWPGNRGSRKPVTE